MLNFLSNNTPIGRNVLFLSEQLLSLEMLIGIDKKVAVALDYWESNE